MIITTNTLQPYTPPICLSIAGSDPSGGAGIQADLKTFSALGCYGAAAITALTVQNTCGVQASQFLSGDFVYSQVAAVIEDLNPQSIKIGMMGTLDIVKAIGRLLSEYKIKNVVLDPVMVATSGDSLLNHDIETREIVNCMMEHLVPHATILTPNLPELVVLCNRECTLEEGAEWIYKKTGCPYILVKGGHSSTNTPTDLLYNQGNISYIEGEYIKTQNTHGTGCTLSSAIAAMLAKGFSPKEATQFAKKYIQSAIEAGAQMNIGHGHGPVNHFFNPLAISIKEK